MTTVSGSSVLTSESPVTVAGAKPTVVITPTRSILDLDLMSVWRSWELLYFLTWRDVKVRYKQTAIGIGWAVLQPVITMLLFTAVFSRLAGVDSNGVPYPVFVFAALLPWTYFSQAVGRGSVSLVSNAGLLTKVYFPRLAIPLSSVIAPLVDFVASLGVVALLLAWYRIVPGWSVLALPLFLVLCVLTALAVSLWLSALCVKYRDVGVIVPFMLQVWLFASPIAYSVDAVPQEWRVLYSLNPLAGVVEGFRWSIAGTAEPDFALMGVSAAMVLILLAGGVVYFKRTEQTFADVV